MLGTARYFLVISFGLFLVLMFALMRKYRD
jgi:hypothetical protein